MTNVLQRFGARADWSYPGARALVLLHEKEMRAFWSTWERARAADLELPPTKDADCANFENLAVHVLGAAAGYLRWTCRVRGQDEVALPEIPSPEAVAAEGPACLETILETWLSPLRDLTEKDADRITAESSWGVVYCIDAMLEHAVMHPMRHRLALEQLLENPA